MLVGMDTALTPVRKMYLAMFVLAASVAILSADFPPYAQEAGYDVAAVGFLVSIAGVFSLLSRLPAGALLSGGAAPIWASGATVVLALSTAAHPLADGLALLTAVRAVNGFAYGVVTTVNMALLMGAIERPEQRAGVTGWYLGWIAAGHAVGGFLSGWLADAFGYQTTFVISGLVALAALPFVAVRAPAVVADAGAHATSPAAGMQWAFIFSLPLMVSALQAFSVNALSQLIWTFYPLYGLGVGLSLSMLGLHRGAYSTTSMIARPLVGQMAQKFSYGAMATWGLVLTAAITLLVPFLNTFLPLLVLNVALGALRAGALVGSMVAAVEYAGNNARKRGMAAGLYHFATDGANVLAPLIGGVVAERIGLAAIFWAMPVALIAVYLALLAVSVGRARRGGAPPLAAAPDLR